MGFANNFSYFVLASVKTSNEYSLPFSWGLRCIWKVCLNVTATGKDIEQGASTLFQHEKTELQKSLLVHRQMIHFNNNLAGSPRGHNSSLLPKHLLYPHCSADQDLWLLIGSAMRTMWLYSPQRWQGLCCKCNTLSLHRHGLHSHTYECGFLPIKTRKAWLK